MWKVSNHDACALVPIRCEVEPDKPNRREGWVCRQLFFLWCGEHNVAVLKCPKCGGISELHLSGKVC
jgi:hypothetical protein